MDITAIKMALAAYTMRDLQHFNHILQYFEGMDTSPAIIRQVIAETIHDISLSHRIMVSRSTTRKSSLPLCPSCGKPLAATLQEGLLIHACAACRWSAIVEGER
ncbi:MAG: zf-TFIIB domain-containing protein [Limnohabitans sp.]